MQGGVNTNPGLYSVQHGDEEVKFKASFKVKQKK